MVPPSVADHRASSVSDALAWIAWTTGFGLVCAGLYGAFARPAGFSNSSTGALLAVLSAAAAFAGGGMLGLLYGSPSMNAASVSRNEPSVVTPNSRLDKVADWLTTMIVGVGLTNLPTIEDRTRKLGTWLTRAVSGDEAAINPIPGAVIVLGFAISGFLFIYLWSLRFLPSEIKRAFGDLSAKVNEAASISTVLDRQLEEFRNKPLFVLTPDILEQFTDDLKVGGVDEATIEDVIGRYSSAKSAIDEPLQNFASQATEGYELDAEVSDVGGGKYKLELTLTTMNSAAPSLAFWLLHNSFLREAVTKCQFAGTPARVTYSTIVDEAFWVGVVVPVPNGPSVRLAYDLRKVPDAPQKFKDTPGMLSADGTT